MNHPKDYTGLQELIDYNFRTIIKNLDEIYDSLEIDFDDDDYSMNEIAYKTCIEHASTIYRTLECEDIRQSCRRTLYLTL